MSRRQSLGVIIMKTTGESLNPTSYFWCVGHMTTLHYHIISALLLQREPLIQALLHSTNFVNQLLDEECKGHHF